MPMSNANLKSEVYFSVQISFITKTAAFNKMKKRVLYTEFLFEKIVIEL